MKASVNIVRILVGVLFIFSGLVKAVDPIGLSYKMQEFFDLWGLSPLDNISLWLSVFIIAFEIIAGVALLLGWQMRLFSWLLLLLIIFFTFLTGYAYFSGKFTNCGCFGDCIPITPKTSFLKDVALTLLILFLFANRKKIQPFFPKSPTLVLMILATILSFGIQWYMLNYLPVIDCLPYKRGNNIAEKMKIPAGAVPDSFAIVFVYEKAGKQFEFPASELPDDLDTYTFVKRRDKLVRKGNSEPPIKGFVLSGPSNEDSTAVVLSQTYAVLLFCEDFSVPISRWEKDFTAIYNEAKAKNIPVYAITSRFDEAEKTFQATAFRDITIFKCDFTAVRTAARSNPTIYLINQGTIMEKQAAKRMGRILSALKSLPAQPPAMDISPPPISDSTH